MCWLLAWSFDQEVAELRKEKRNALHCVREHTQGQLQIKCVKIVKSPSFGNSYWVLEMRTSSTFFFSCCSKWSFLAHLWTIQKKSHSPLFLQALCFQDHLVKIRVITLSRWKSFLPLFCFSASSLCQVTQQGNLQGWFNSSESFEAE